MGSRSRGTVDCKMAVFILEWNGSAVGFRAGFAHTVIVACDAPGVVLAGGAIRLVR